MKDSICIVVPIYKPVPNPLETLSLLQGSRVLASYPLIFVTHPDLDLTCYRTLCPQAKYVFFNKRYFESIDGYNDLMLSRGFYVCFATYEFMLIYQTDAWVFRDELLEWCARGYDYIGGLWVETGPRHEILGGTCGNGGLSLRRVATFLRVTRKNYRVKGWSDLVASYLHYRGGDPFYLFWYLGTFFPKLLFLILPRLVGFRNTYDYFRNEDKIGEDRIFVHKILSNRHYRVPNLEEGHGFSWELQLEGLWTRYGTLPFGCHAWTRDEYFGERVLDFWKIHMPVPAEPAEAQ